jgi:hypothetical protein
MPMEITEDKTVYDKDPDQIQHSMVVIYRQGFQSRAQYLYSAAFLEAVLP